MTILDVLATYAVWSRLITYTHADRQCPFVSPNPILAKPNLFCLWLQLNLGLALKLGLELVLGLGLELGEMRELQTERIRVDNDRF